MLDMLDMFCRHLHMTKGFFTPFKGHLSLLSIGGDEVHHFRDGWQLGTDPHGGQGAILQLFLWCFFGVIFFESTQES